MKILTEMINPNLANVSILYPPKTPKNLWFSVVFMGYKLGTLEFLNSPASIYLFKVNNRNTRRMCEIWSKLTIKTPVFLFLTLNIFLTFFLCFYCWLWTSTCQLGSNDLVFFYKFFENDYCPKNFKFTQLYLCLKIHIRISIIHISIYALPITQNTNKEKNWYLLVALKLLQVFKSLLRYLKLSRPSVDRI